MTDQMSGERNGAMRETDDVPQPKPEAAPADRWNAETAVFVERFAAELIDAGLQPTAARVFSCLLADDEGALSSAELVRRLKISPAAISGAVRYLGQVHLVSRERQPGTRRELYRVHHNVWYEAMANRDALLNRWISTLQEGLPALGPDTPAGERISETVEYLLFLRSELDGVLDRWRALRRSQGHLDPEERPRQDPDG
ncbi:GbsR/MarR family transcriptional regulator [Streptomyces sp. YIM 98790]|uniref:GbsR/MarR family transcriptional regulator n=1 Tax=Streptomyces sp. YIM 98790 TaxID=2689077 RepID=UPI001FB7BBB9|nr:MarR family transcriptional regulator [Streptomyces sp. YIM 98790]